MLKIIAVNLLAFSVGGAIWYYFTQRQVKGLLKRTNRTVDDLPGGQKALGQYYIVITVCFILPLAMASILQDIFLNNETLWVKTGILLAMILAFAILTVFAAIWLFPSTRSIGKKIRELSLEGKNEA